MIEVETPDGRVIEFPDGTSPEVIKQQMRKVSGQPDASRGAPLAVRAAVGAAVTPEDRAKTIAQFYPDAIQTAPGQFSFTDPHTGRETLYNPPGLDLGDVVSIGPEVAEFAGGTLGALGGTAMAVPTAVPTGGASFLTVPAATGLGAAAGREMYNTWAERVLGTADTRTMPEQLMDPVVTAAGNAVGQTLADRTMAGVRAVAGPVARRAVSTPSAPAMLNDYARIGVTPRLPGAATGNRGMQMFEQGLYSSPGGAAPMQRATQQTVDEVSRAADRLAQRFASATRSQAPLDTETEIGEVVQAGAKGAIDRFMGRSEQLYNNVYAAIPAGSRAPVTNSAQLLQRIEQQVQQAPESLGPTAKAAANRLAALMQDAQGGGVPFEALRQIRTNLGRELGAPPMVGENTASRAYLQQMYEALTTDLNAHAIAVNPRAARDLFTADRYYRFNMSRNVPALNKIISADAPEKAFQAAMQGTRQGGSRLASLRRNFRPEEWDLVAGSVLNRLGRPTPGVQGAREVGEAADEFSVNTFLTNYNKLSPEAQRALFTGTRYMGLSSELGSLARVVDGLKDSAQMGNPSGTARTVAVLGLLGAGGQAAVYQDPTGAAATVAGAFVAPRVAAKLITNPAFVRWLVQGARSNRAEFVAGQMGRLYAVAEANPEIRGEIAQYVDALRAAPAPQQLPATSPQTQQRR